jgi:hypothetical protein
MALSRKSRNIIRESPVNIAIKINERVPRRKVKCRTSDGRVLNNTLNIVATSTRANGLERRSDDRGAECAAEELPQGDGVGVDRDLGVGGLPADIVGELHAECEGRGLAGYSGSREGRAGEGGEGGYEDGELHFDG